MSIIKRGLTEMSASVLTVCECQWSRCLNTSWLEGFSVVHGECQCCALFYYTDCHFNSYVGYRRSFTVCTECNFVNKLQKPVFHPRGSLIRKLTCSTVVSAPFCPMHPTSASEHCHVHYLSGTIKALRISSNLTVL